MYERRINRRFGFREKVTLQVRKGGLFRRSIEAVNASVEDLSRGGLQIVTEHPLECNDRLLFALQPSFLEHSLTGKGRIRYVKPVQKFGHPAYVAGIQFTSVNRGHLIGIIGRMNGWRRGNRIPHTVRREAAFMLKCLPFLLLASWLLADVMLRAESSRMQEKRYTEKLKEAVIYGLYHM